jgi:hypothetical protein
MARDSAGNLYVSDRDTANVTRFAPSSQASFAVTLDSVSTSPVSVNYSTGNGTALAGTDYTQTSGTLVFPAGVTSETVNVPITTVATGGPTKTFTVNLSGASGATISRAQGTGSILNRQTKFFVVDSGSVKTYQYGTGGTSEEITEPYYTNDTAPRGVATTAAGTTVWVVDANESVYVYTNHGVLLGSWSAGGLNSSAMLTGIATNGTDIWLLDSYHNQVYKYSGAASRLSGSQSAASSFMLGDRNTRNSNAQDIVTDGTSFWVVDASQLKVTKYTLSGSQLGSWSIDPANAHPTGITINPNNVSDIWIVDSGTLKVYQYVGAASRTSGRQNASATFALNPSDTNPQGIADPPPADLPLTPTAAPLALDSSPAAAPSAVPSALPGMPSLASRDTVFAQPVPGWLPRPGQPAVALLAGEVLIPRLDSLPPAADHPWAPAAASGGDKPTVPLTPLVSGNDQESSFDIGAVGVPDDPSAGQGNPVVAAATDAFFAGLTEGLPADQG